MRGVWRWICGTSGERNDRRAPGSGGGRAPGIAGRRAAECRDLFPEGPQKAAVINNCASCHNLACSVIGQRTAERWDSLKASHKEHAPGADVEAMFAYLKANFDSTRPEPKVPPAFLEGGCTPF